MDYDTTGLIVGLLIAGTIYFGATFLWGFCFPITITGAKRIYVLAFGLLTIASLALFSAILILRIIVGPQGTGHASVFESFTLSLFILANMWWVILVPTFVITFVGLEMAESRRTVSAKRALAEGSEII